MIEKFMEKIAASKVSEMMAAGRLSRNSIKKLEDSLNNVYGTSTKYIDNYIRRINKKQNLKDPGRFVLPGSQK